MHFKFYNILEQFLKFEPSLHPIYINKKSSFLVALFLNWRFCSKIGDFQNKIFGNAGVFSCCWKTVLLTTTLGTLEFLLSSPTFRVYIRLICTKILIEISILQRRHEAAAGYYRHFLCLLAFDLWSILFARFGTGYILWKRRTWKMCGKFGLIDFLLEIIYK